MICWASRPRATCRSGLLLHFTSSSGIISLRFLPRYLYAQSYSLLWFSCCSVDCLSHAGHARTAGGNTVEYCPSARQAHIVDFESDTARIHMEPSAFRDPDDCDCFLVTTKRTREICAILILAYHRTSRSLWLWPGLFFSHTDSSPFLIRPRPWGSVLLLWVRLSR